MEKAIAVQIANLLAEYPREWFCEFDVERIAEGEIDSFHEWADYKPLISADRITRRDGETLYLLLIDWAENDNYYCVLFPPNRSGPIAEIHRYEMNAGGGDLIWKYMPHKWDGRNTERKDYFRRHVGDTIIYLSVPTRIQEVDRFLQDAFDLVENRVKADRLDPDEPEIRSKFQRKP